MLGPVDVRHEDASLPTGSARERFVLATLLLNAGRLVSTEHLVNSLWRQPPASAKAQLHNMVSKIRSRLKSIDDQLIVTRTSGYELRLRAHRLDVTEFRGYVAQGRRAAAAADHTGTRAILERALRIWRGPALADVPDELATDLRMALADELLAAAELKLNAELALGQFDEVLRGTAPLLAEHPYAEQLYRLQMSALAGAGRRADALAAYRRAYRRFTDDLGVEPSSVLRALEQRILQGAPVVDAPSPRLLPRQLPALHATVTGRDGLLGQITTRLAGGASDVLPVVVLVGSGGVGKTALAVSVGRRLEHRYPDGQLYADLRGSHANPSSPHDVAGRFLRALGVPGTAVPEDPDERIAMYRSRLADGRVLVVLDDAADEAQVRPLLPGSPRCGALVTSRRQLAALMEVARFSVPQLPVEDAVRLLARLGGGERVATEPGEAARLVELCGGLPLAVCIAAARLGVRPDWPLAEFVDRLAAERSRLDELALGDLDVRASIGLSYRALPPGARELFRRLGLLVTPTWPRWVAEALRPGDHHLDQLIDVHLVESVGVDGAGQQRYRLHDLVADYATEQTLAGDPAVERTEALGRVLAGWLARATDADDGLTPDTEAPYEWFEAERGSLVDAVAAACQIGDPATAGALALRLKGFLAVRGYDDDRERVLRTALDCVRAGGPDQLLAHLLSAQFECAGQLDRRHEMPGIAEEALAVARRIGDHEQALRALSQAARAARMHGRFDDARAWLIEAVAAARGPGVEPGLLASALEALGHTYTDAGDPARAVPLFSEAVELSRAQGGRHRRLAQTLHSSATALLYAGRTDDAERATTEALAIAKEIRDDVGAAYLEHMIGEIHLRRRGWRDAATWLDRALVRHEKHRNSEGIAEVTRLLAELSMAQGRPRDAFPALRRSLGIWREMGTVLEVARTLQRLELAYRAVGDGSAADDHRRRWQAILGELKLPESCLRSPDHLTG